jgi:hypothetical protein
LNIISAYGPQVGLSESEKMKFWEDLDVMVRAVPTNENLVIANTFFGKRDPHLVTFNSGYRLS